MRRGEIWFLTVPGIDQLRAVLVVSNDHANTDHRYRPAALDIHTPRTGIDHGVYHVELAGRDPMTGHLVDATTVTNYTRTRFVGTPLGIITGASFAKVNAALKTWLDIP